jgi:protocatechuate 3,4-dioxygenase beta subunit
MNVIILILAAVLHIAPSTEPGQRLMLTGRVFGADGRPRAGVEMRVWHTDARGLYHAGSGDAPPRLQGTTRTAADGSYAIDTIKPGLYPGATHGAHMHFSIDGHPDLILFDGPKAIPLTRDAKGVLHGTHDFHLGGGAK